MNLHDDTEAPPLAPMSVEAHMAVQTVQMRHMAQSLDRIEAKQEASVPRSEWEQRNGYVDGRFQAADSATKAVAESVTKLEGIVQAARAPWWVVLGSGLGIVSCVVAVLTVMGK